MEKGEIRKLMRARRKAMSARDRAEASRAICAKLLARVDVRRTVEGRRPIAVYLASPEEVDLKDFIVAALARGASLVVPRWNGALYELAPLTSLADLVAGPHDILEPPPPPRPSSLVPRPSLWLLPGLAFTRDGKRLGYGGGWYDRFLAEADPQAARIGIAFGFQVLDALPTEPHDCLLTEVVTEEDVGS